ncbi:GIY-YIG catalytic domain-containing protein [Roseimicrobium gellanilyticum]|uniref:GIY-YIG catalytic domain-containing protein n=1 Tax=Roseimicrobium gellanilyticum TaxID=748857 RepID=A0A366HUD0_9BACT|nr:nucleotide excision repair endonuclease [Roseimicrobium gellanilyticum]RBP47450.1 GIY-YIG catalytic domain-containing protein [Roseimicrobium gellanilyticum]
MKPPDPTEIATGMSASVVRPRQMRLFQVTNPITTRVGAEVFAGLPQCPGVYFFYDLTGKLLYIGQSLNLRARVTSYRHVSPERHPRRILRLVHRIARIEWQTCESAGAAIELERVLLLEHRPPFNRAGTWQPPPWYLRITVRGEHLHLSLTREGNPAVDAPSDESSVTTIVSPVHAPARSLHPPLPLLDDSAAEASQHLLTEAHTPDASPAFALPRSIHAALCRCVMRLHHPQLPLSEYPAGLLNFTAPLHLRLPFPGNAVGVACQLSDFLSGRSTDLLEALKPLMIEVPDVPADGESGAPETTPDPDSIAAYWSTQVEMLQQFAVKKLPGLLMAE